MPAFPQRTFTDQEIVERCIYALINEGARGSSRRASLQRASDIDVIYLNGYGFPAWRGGPMFYADRTGLRTIHDRITALHQELGDRWRRRRSSTRLASSGRTFREISIGMADILPSETILERRADGTLYARSPVPLGRYPDKITERLEHWADRTPRAGRFWQSVTPPECGST